MTFTKLVIITLSNALRNEVEIVSFRKGHHVIKNGSGRWIYGISIGFHLVESLIYLKIKLELVILNFLKSCIGKKRRAPNIIWKLKSYEYIFLALFVSKATSFQVAMVFVIIFTYLKYIYKSKMI